MSQLNLQELDRFTSELASFARSGVPMPEGLAQLQANLPASDLRRLSADMAEATSQGQPLSEALRSSKVKVPDSFAALVRCGEISGDMGGVLDFALENGRRIRRHRASMSTLFIYPMLVLLLLIIMFSLALIFIVPQFKEIYDQLGAELPGPTQLLVNIGYALANGGAVILLMLTALVIYLLIAALRERLPVWMTAGIPGVRGLVSLSDTATMTEFVGRLLDRGVPLPDACRAASLVVTDHSMRASLERMADTAESGGPSGQELNPRIPATAAWLYRQGEARGNLAEACGGIARYCESRFDLLSRRTLYLMEPLLILGIALLVGFCVIALYLPLFNIPKIVGR